MERRRKNGEIGGRRRRKRRYGREEGFYLPTYSAVPNEILVSLSGSNFLVEVKSISLILDPPSFLNMTFWG